MTRSRFVSGHGPAGAPPAEARLRSALEVAIAGRERLVTDAGAFQEILHRYVAINRRAAIEPAWNAMLGVVDEVYPIELADVARAGPRRD